MTSKRSILFDLDGTLIDTAPDMTYTLNQLRLKHQLDELPLSTIRPLVSLGARAMIKAGFNGTPFLDHTETLLEEFLDLYALHSTKSTRLFPGIDVVLDFLENSHTPWGIVTNKPERFTIEILKSLNLLQRAGVLVCGDTLAKRKPDPEPVLHACNVLKQDIQHCLFIGDSVIDVLASKAAGTRSLVALYGYIEQSHDPYAWQADGYIHHPLDIIQWLKAHPET